MTLELHIWGPAFGLPSIDAECLAVLTYLDQHLEPRQWVLVPAHDPIACPTGDFPALRHEGSWIGGFANIVQYLETNILETTRTTSAETTALTIHLRSNASPLLDAILYASHTNYTTTTRPAYASILPSYASYTVPPRRHAAALSRTVSLGLSSGTIDSIDPSTSQDEAEARLASTSPSLIFRRKQTLQAALREKQSTAYFRIEGLTDNLCEVVEQVLGERNFLGEKSEKGRYEPVDCLAFGYLALLLYAPVPNAWVADTVRKKYRRVMDFVGRMRRDLFAENEFDVRSIMSPPPEKKDSWSQTRLPWGFPPPLTLRSSCTALIHSLTAHMVSPLHRLDIFGPGTFFTSAADPKFSFFTPLRIMFALSGPLLAGASYALYAYAHADQDKDKYFGPPRSKLSAFGDAGAALGAIGGNRTVQEPPLATRSPEVDASEVWRDGREAQTRKQDTPDSGEEIVRVEFAAEPESTDVK